MTLERSKQLVALAAIFILFTISFAPAVGAAPSKFANDSSTATFKPLTSATGSELHAVAAAMSKRLDVLGDRSSNASVDHSIIIVHLEAGTDTTFVLSVLGTTGQFYFRRVLCAAPAFAKPTSGAIPTTASSLPVCSSPYLYESSDFSSSQGTSFTYPPTDNVFAAYQTTVATLDDPRKTVILNGNGQWTSPRLVLGPAEISYQGRNQLLNSTMIKNSHARFEVSTKQWSVIFNLTAFGSKLFNTMASLDYGVPVAEDLDGTVIAAPIIEATSFPSSGQVTGNFNKQRASGLAAELDSGPLPVAVELVHRY